MVDIVDKNRENEKLVAVWIPSRIFYFEETPQYQTWINSMSHFFRLKLNRCSMFGLGGALAFPVQSKALEVSYVLIKKSIVQARVHFFP
jgi:hypothetical protein